MNDKTLQELALKFKGASFRGTVAADVSMKTRTTMQVGGVAPIVIEPHDVSSLVNALRILQGQGIPAFVMGGGSNLVVSDDGFDIPIISTRGLVNEPIQNGATVTCAAGVAMAHLVDYCTDHALTGLETFAGLPGTVGGAVYMNARCFEREISDVLAGADYVEGDATPLVQHYDMDKADWSYKVSPFQGTSRIITSASFCVSPGNKEEIAARCKGYIEERRKRGHFRAPCAGSVFRNNRAFGKSSGALIDEAGLKGMAIGGAQIAPWHGNIIVNTGTATARDIAALVKAAHDAVQEKTGCNMECEVVFCGVRREVVSG